MTISDYFSPCICGLLVEYLKEFFDKVFDKYKIGVDKMVVILLMLATIMSLMGYTAGVPRGLRPQQGLL